MPHSPSDAASCHLSQLTCHALLWLQANSSSSSSANNITSAGLGGTVPRPPPIGSRLPPKLRAECMAMSVEELRARVAQEERLLQRDRAVVLVREGFL